MCIWALVLKHWIISVGPPQEVQQVVSQEQRWELSMVLSGMGAMMPYRKGSGVEQGYTMSEQAVLL